MRVVFLDRLCTCAFWDAYHYILRVEPGLTLETLIRVVDTSDDAEYIHYIHDLQTVDKLRRAFPRLQQEPQTPPYRYHDGDVIVIVEGDRYTVVTAQKCL